TNGALFDLLGTADEGFALSFCPTGNLMRVIQALQPEIEPVRDYGKDRMRVQPIIKRVSMQDENFRSTAFENAFISDGHSEQVRNNIGGTVMIARNPGNIQMIGKLADEGKDFPMPPGQAAKVHGLKDISVENEFGGAEPFFGNIFQEIADVFGLAGGTSKMNVG